MITFERQSGQQSMPMAAWEKKLEDARRSKLF